MLRVTTYRQARFDVAVLQSTAQQNATIWDGITTVFPDIQTEVYSIVPPVLITSAGAVHASHMLTGVLNRLVNNSTLLSCTRQRVQRRSEAVNFDIVMYD